MEEEFMKQSNPVRRIYLIGYIIGGLLLITLTIISISLDEWFTYCYWNFGLVQASTTMKHSAFKNENSISDVRADSCHGLKDTIQAECPKFCDFPTRFEFAGAFLLLMSIVSIISQVFAIFYHFLRCKRRNFKLGSISFLICFTFGVQLIGFLTYYFLSGFVELKSTKNEGLADKKPQDFDWLEGMGIYLSVVVLQCGLMVFGLIFTKRGFS